MFVVTVGVCAVYKSDVRDSQSYLMPIGVIYDSLLFARSKPRSSSQSLLPFFQTPLHAATGARGSHRRSLHQRVGTAVGWRLGPGPLPLSRRHTFGEARVTGETERDPCELTQWQGVGWIY